MPEARSDCNVSAPDTAATVGKSTIEHQVVGALRSIGAATLASRVLGFVRDMVVALVFGAGPVTDAFFVAYRIPNMLRRLLAEGALSTAVIPVFSDYLVNQPREACVRMLRAVLTATLLVLSVTVAAGMVFSPWLVRLIAPGFTADPGQAALTVLLTRILFPYLLLVGLAALGMGLLNSQGRFFAAALGPAIFNVGMILGVVVLRGHLDPPRRELAKLRRLLIAQVDEPQAFAAARPVMDAAHVGTLKVIPQESLYHDAPAMGAFENPPT